MQRERGSRPSVRQWQVQTNKVVNKFFLAPEHHQWQQNTTQSILTPRLPDVSPPAPLAFIEMLRRSKARTFSEQASELQLPGCHCLQNIDGQPRGCKCLGPTVSHITSPKIEGQSM